MLERARTIAVACAALASAGCPSLDALECHGTSCADAAAGDGTTGGDAYALSEAAAGPDAGIFCGPSEACVPPGNECCVTDDAGPSCTPVTGCGGTDIFCDDPSQCPGGGTCWICINVQGFQGTSCDYQGDIVANDHCDPTTALPLCHSSSQCEGGTTCKPIDVPALDAGTGTSWFRACQP
jgi:hypothetical protein